MFAIMILIMICENYSICFRNSIWTFTKRLFAKSASDQALIPYSRPSFYELNYCNKTYANRVFSKAIFVEIVFNFVRVKMQGCNVRDRAVGCTLSYRK